MTFVPNIDLFASRLNANTDCFVSWHPEPGAIAEHLKTSKPGKSLEVKFMSLPEDPSLCTMSTLGEYILSTEKLRSSSKLFISFIRPHKPVSTSTVGRWIKSVLSSAGIDISVFKAHSVRGAAVTNAYIKIKKFYALLTGQMNVHFVNITSESTLSWNNLFMKFLH